MLVLSRRVNERIMIGDDVALMVCGIRGDKVRLGIKAPPGVEVHREEVYRLVQRQKGRPSDDWSPRTVPDAESASVGVGSE